MARARLALTPESQVSPMPVKAVRKRASDTAIRRSQARAKPRPAPAQLPLIEASTGLGIVASPWTIGL